MYNDFHFMTLLPTGGIHAYRPHPGKDINGWGTTWYAQPFLPGATLQYATVDSVVASDLGVFCYSHGLVSRGEFEHLGHWNMNLYFEYIAEMKKIIGTGGYYILLDSILSDSTGDLNLFKIASNYLFDVPLLCDPYYGETGDMYDATVIGSGSAYPFTWSPMDGDLFEFDHTDTLCIDISGQYNNVDTEVLGDPAIEPAYKSGMKVILGSFTQGLR